MSTIAEAILGATDSLCKGLSPLKFAEPVTHVYNPLEYARAPHQKYVEKFGSSKKKALFLGMNPGPWGMAQTGVPFGEIPAVRDWMGISEQVEPPKVEHPKRPIQGFACEKSEVSGRRLWGYFADEYKDAESFFSEHYVINYCPLVWMEESGRNRTPDKLPKAEMSKVNELCDQYIAKHLELMSPDYLIGVGAFAQVCLRRVCKQVGYDARIEKILHPSPASPAANRGWAEQADRQIKEIWNKK